MDSSLPSISQSSSAQTDPKDPSLLKLPQIPYASLSSPFPKIGPSESNSRLPASAQAVANAKSTLVPNYGSLTGTGDGGNWTKVEKRKEKRAKKNVAKAVNQPPSFAFNVQELVKMRTVPISVSSQA